MAAALSSLALLLLSGSHEASAQESRPQAGRKHAAGSVATVLIPIPDAYAARYESIDDSREHSARYSVGLTPGFRLIGARNGTVTWREGEKAVLPLTLQLPPAAKAGHLNAGSVQFGNERELGPIVAVTLEVASSHGFDLAASTPSVSVEPGGELEIIYSMRSAGNADDSVAVRVETGMGFDPSPLATKVRLPAFETATGSLVARVLPDVAPGTELFVRVVAFSPRAEEKATIRAFVRSPEGVLPGLAQLPTAVFLGSTVTSFGGQVESSPLFGVSGSGEIARNTDVLFSFRSGDSEASSFVFQDVFATPRLRLGVRRPDWHLLAGDVDLRTSDLLGYYLPGRGGTAAWSRGRASLAGIVARPQTPDGRILDGHVVSAEGGWGLERLRFAGLLSSTARSDYFGLPGSLTQAGLARFEGRPAQGHLFSLDAGWMRIRDEASGEEATGPAFNARYSFRNEDASLDLTARRRPMSSADPRLPPQQFQMSGSARVSPSATILGAVYDEVLAAGSDTEESRNNGGYLGVRLGRRPLIGELTARIRTRSGARRGHLGTMRGAIWTRAGPIDVDASAEIGPQTLDGSSGTYRQFRLGGSIRRGHTWARLAARYSSDLNLSSLWLYEAYLSHSMGPRLEAYASASAYDGAGSLDGSFNVQVGAAFRVVRDLRAYAGIENLSREIPGSSRWRLSAGIQKGLAVPVPLRRPSAVEGIVFEDLDADGSLDEGEPLLDGVRVRLGLDESFTRNGGRFEFRQELGNRLSIDAGSLGPEFLPPADVPFQPGERVMVPVSRAGGLEVDVFLDENANGAWDPEEQPLARASVSIHSESAAGWSLVTGADGRLILDAIRPGSYRIAIDRSSLPGLVGATEDAIIEVRGGEMTVVPIAVPLRQIPMATFGSFEDEAPAAEAGSGGR